jgi:threonine dehydrogenase-like Zn-dependent dehydrogenase
MRVLLVGAGGVGTAVVGIAARRDFFEHLVVADYDLERARRAVSTVDGRRFSATRVDASSAAAVAELCREHRITHVLNAVDPRFVMPIFDGAFAAGADYLDMAMSLSAPHPDRPFQETGVKLGDDILLLLLLLVSVATAAVDWTTCRAVERQPGPDRLSRCVTRSGSRPGRFRYGRRRVPSHRWRPP